MLVVIGATGQLGRDLVLAARRRGLDCRGLGHDAIEIADEASIERALAPLAPEVVLNTAAYQGARTYTAGEQERYFAGNALGPWNLARWCARRGAILVHYSTDYVFGGDGRDRPYAEDDLPCPRNAYGASKLAGEHLARAAQPRSFVLRVASLYGHGGSRAKGGSNFVQAIVERARRGEALSVVGDQTMSPTWTRDVAGKTLELLEARAPFGLYHLAGSGSCTWHELAREALRAAGLDAPVARAATDPEPAGALFLRPRYTALRNTALRRAGLADLPDWRAALGAFVTEMPDVIRREMQHA